MDKTYVFDNNDGGCCGGNNMMPLIAALCQNRGVDPNMLAAMMNNRNGWGDGAWWIIILLIFGWGGFGNGFGGGFNGRGTAQGLADLGNLVNNDTGRELLKNAIQGNANAISQLASQVHCDTNALQGSIQNLSTQLGNLGLGQKDVIFAIQSGNQNILSKLCDCCCDTQRQIADFRGDISLQMCQQTNTLGNAINNVATGMERGFSSVAYETQRQTCDITKAISDSTAQILAGQKAAEFREMQRELQALRDERAQYQMSALLQTQSANLINTLRPCPVPSYPTCNPWGCNGNYYGNGYPYGNNGCCGNSGCGCC